MRTNSEMAQSFRIFARYEQAAKLGQDHDVIYAGPDPAKVSPEDLEQLEANGWRVCEDYDCFQLYT